MRKRLTLVLTLALAVAVIGAALTYAGGGRGFHNGGPRHGRGDGPFANLTEEQRAEIQGMVKEMRESGATCEDIREAVGAKLHEWGIEVPEKRGPFADLSEEQRAEIQEMVEGMKAEEASREAIRAAVHGKLEEWGVEVPERQGSRPMRGSGGFPPPLPGLTEEQQATIRDMVKEMREAGAAREEIRAAVDAKLQEYGIEVPEHQRRRPGRGPRGFRPPHVNLTEEQRAEIQGMVKEMRESGATREDIREAVGAKLEEWDIEVPEKTGPRHGHGRVGFRMPFRPGHTEESAETEETGPEVSPKVTATSTVQSTSWGKVKSQFK